MTINDIYNTLCVDGVMVLEGEALKLDDIRARLIKKKYREQKKHGEFADRSVVLRFDWQQLETAEQLAKLEITLTSRGEELVGVNVC